MSVGSWNTKPICGRAPSLQMISPSLAGIRPAMRRRIVDLPQPDGPSSVRNSPRRTSRSTPARASTPPGKVLAIRLSRKRLSSDRRSTNGSTIGQRRRRCSGPDRQANLVYESEGIGPLVIGIRRDDFRRDHLVEKTPHSLVCHSANAEPARIAGIDDAIFLQLGGGESELAVTHLRIVLLDPGIRLGTVGIEIIVPADDRSIDKALYQVRLLRDEIGARLDRGRIAIVAIIREQENVGLEAALPLDFVGLRGDVTLLNRVFIRDERRRIEIVWLHLLFAK